MILTGTDEPTSLKEQQRQATRAWIRKAARACFLREGIGNVSMEAIATEAGIRRATLYLYYPGKNTLLLDLLEQSLRATDRIYMRLRDLPAISRIAVREWIAGYLREVADNSGAVDLFRSEILPDEKLRLLMREHIQRSVDLLGQRFPFFDRSAAAGPEEARRRFEAEWMLGAIDAFCGEARMPDYHLDREAGLDVLADRLTPMLADPRPLPAG